MRVAHSRYRDISVDAAVFTDLYAHNEQEQVKTVPTTVRFVRNPGRAKTATPTVPTAIRDSQLAGSCTYDKILT